MDPHAYPHSTPHQHPVRAMPYRHPAPYAPAVAYPSGVDPHAYSHAVHRLPYSHTPPDPLAASHLSTPSHADSTATQSCANGRDQRLDEITP